MTLERFKSGVLWLVLMALENCRISRRGLLKVIGAGAVGVFGGCDEIMERIEGESVESDVKYTLEELRDLQNVLYGEAANQSRRGRKFIMRMTLNRVESSDYSNSIYGVIFDDRNTFSCTFDKKNKNWNQAIGELPRNEYENMIYGRCGEDARAILDGERLGVDREDEIIAYHDVSVKYEDLAAKEKVVQKKWAKKGKRYDGFWMKLELVEKVDRLIFYAPKKG